MAAIRASLAASLAVAASSNGTRYKGGRLPATAVAAARSYVNVGAAAASGRRSAMLQAMTAGLFVWRLGRGGKGAEAAVLEADDDVELLERVKKDRIKRLQRQGVINSSSVETGYLQELIYRLSKIGEAIDSNNLAAASSVLGTNTDAEWVQNINSAFTKLSSSSEEMSEVDKFNSSLALLFSSVNGGDVSSSKTAFVSSATALERWVGMTGLSSQLKGL